MRIIHLFKQTICQAYRLSFCISLFVLSALNFTTLHADHHHSQSDDLELGIALETEYWTLVQNKNVKKFSAKLLPIFQGLNILGVYTREEQISGLAASTLFSFSINNPVSHRSGDTLVFSYDFVAIGSGLTSGPSITVWRKHKHSWKIASHSYVPFVE